MQNDDYAQGSLSSHLLIIIGLEYSIDMISIDSTRYSHLFFVVFILGSCLALLSQKVMWRFPAV